MAYAIIGLLFILLVVFAVLSAKTWHWINIVFLILAFISGVAACAGLAQVYKLRVDAMNYAKNQEDRRVSLEKQVAEATFGSIQSIEYDENSLRGVNQMLTQELSGRGRVWPSGQIEKVGENRIFKFAATRPDDPDGNNSMQDMVLYAFADGVIGDGVAPLTYIGTVRVVSESPQQVELQKVFIANTDDYDTIASTWSLFEKMPSDRRDTFKKVENITDESFDIAAYRQLLMSKYLPRDSFAALDDEQYEDLIDRYAFDGLPLATINKWIEDNRDSRHPNNLTFG